MIHEVSGDLLLSKAQIIAHGVAPNDEFKSGLALALRERWPAMYKDFRHFCHTKGPKPGETWSWAGAGGRVVALLTQEAPEHNHAHPGKANHHNVNAALKALAAQVREEDVRSVALPRLATGVGGMDWTEVREMLNRQLGDLDADIYVYTQYQPGVQAVEPGL